MPINRIATQDTNLITLIINAGHGEIVQQGFVTFNLVDGTIRNSHLPFTSHEKIANAWLQGDIDQARKVCSQLQDEYSSLNCPYTANCWEL